MDCAKPSCNNKSIAKISLHSIWNGIDDDTRDYDTFYCKDHLPAGIENASMISDQYDLDFGLEFDRAMLAGRAIENWRAIIDLRSRVSKLEARVGKIVDDENEGNKQRIDFSKDITLERMIDDNKSEIYDLDDRVNDLDDLVDEIVDRLLELEAEAAKGPADAGDGPIFFDVETSRGISVDDISGFNWSDVIRLEKAARKAKDDNNDPYALIRRECYVTDCDRWVWGQISNRENGEMVFGCIHHAHRLLKVLAKLNRRHDYEYSVYSTLEAESLPPDEASRFLCFDFGCAHYPVYSVRQTGAGVGYLENHYRFYCSKHFAEVVINFRNIGGIVKFKGVWGELSNE